MKNLKTLFILSISLVMLNNALLSAQETEEPAEEATFNFSGTVDTYFRDKLFRRSCSARNVFC